MRRRWAVALGLVAVGLVTAAAGAFAASGWTAAQNGSRQQGEAEASRVSIRVEAGLDANQVFVPDGFGCGTPTLAGPTTDPQCQGGSLVFSIQNQSQVPLRVEAIQQGTIHDPQGSSCHALSDKYEDGTFAFGPTCTRSTGVGTPNSCALDVEFAPPNFGQSPFSPIRPWPVIPPQGTLQVNGSDNSQLGLGMIHLINSTPSGCEGASFYIPLTVGAFDAT